MLETLVGKELLREVHVRRHHTKGALLGPALVGEQVAKALDIIPSLGHRDGEVAAAEAERVVHHDEVLVLVANLAKHVVPHDADVDVAGDELTNDVGGALEPHLHAGHVGDLRGVLTRVDLSHLELAFAEEVHGVLGHAALAWDAHADRVARLHGLAVD